MQNSDLDLIKIISYPHNYFPKNAILQCVVIIVYVIH